MSVINIKGCETAYIEAVSEGNKKSATAKNIFNYLENAKHEFDVIILDDHFENGQMLTDQDQSGDEAKNARAIYMEHFGEGPIKRPTVLWNPACNFEYYSNVIGVRENRNGDILSKRMKDLESGDYFYKYIGKYKNTIIKIPVIQCTLSTMPPWIVLYHELGHVKQYYEGTGDLASCWTKRLIDPDSIEADNLSRHEQPICDEAGYGIRSRYKHIKQGFSSILETYKDLNKPALRISLPRERKKHDIELEEKAQENINNNPDTGFFFFERLTKPKV